MFTIQPSTLFLCILALLPAVATTAGIQKRWTTGDTATAPTVPSVTDDCRYWANNITADDTYSSLQTYFDITFTELSAWNPAMLQNYCFLVEGYSYCVEGPAVPANASTATSVDRADSTNEPHFTFHEVDDDSESSNSTNSSNGTDTSTDTNATTSATTSAEAEAPSPTSAASGFSMSSFSLGIFLVFLGICL
ncbi:hypothetical protein BDW59DRAFT_163432 [Aspergillus cavernicola]|uniref:LysM domain-containing protein n=1 Tax=Aspergillus cavernicola TaxID=176166 RepID=A0ABR4I680_9EURO